MTEQTKYALKFVFPGGSQKVRRFEGKPRNDMTLSDVRAKVDPADGSFCAKPWFFKNDSDTKPAIERSEEAHNRVVDLLRRAKEAEDPPQEPPEGKGKPAGVKAVEGTMHIYIKPAEVVPADDLEGASAAVKIGEDPACVLKFETAGKDTTLSAVRAALDTQANLEIPDDAVFINSDNKRLLRTNEDKEVVANLDPTPKVLHSLATYSINMWSKEKPPTGWKDAFGDSPPVELPAPIELAKPTKIPPNLFPELPVPEPLATTEDVVRWTELSEGEQYAIARASGLFYGFNLPETSSARENDDTNFPSGTGALSTLDRSSRMFSVVRPGNIEGDGITALQVDESSSYSRLETDVRRSLSTASSLKVAYEGYGAAEAEFKSATASRTNNLEEKFFLSATILVPKAELRLPPIEKVQSGQIDFNYQLHIDVDKASTATHIYGVMARWGALVAWKVIVGGALYIVESKTITAEFETDKEKLEWSVGLKGGQGPLSVSASNQGTSDAETTRQANEQFKDAHMTAYGGSVAYAIGKEIGKWVDSVSPPNAWATIGVDDLRPIYELLDEARRDKFTNLLFRGGQSAWEKNTTLASLRFIPFDWYMRPALKRVYDDFD